eukprot:CAMPEP_0172043030 /NCGR_PEP_ID=MMETSP1041-20130122/26028_1 /TAXON_ID=464988 /ORGANISM="Hemiselmis andersenii, Strain CCMP439" /LENGTH=47 /DNA_ID= /DNA_START= /DNA_END= /DNA_ORIENTATION=
MVFREKRDPSRVVRGSAAPRSVGIPKNWNAEKAAEDALKRAAKSKGK